MFQKRAERKLDSIKNLMDSIELDSKVLFKNPLLRNKKQVLLDISYLRRKLNEYNRAVKELPCKYEYQNRGQRL